MKSQPHHKKKKKKKPNQTNLNHFDVQLQLARISPRIQREKSVNWKQKNKTSTNKTQPL
jgi:hypothetical protein